MEVFRHSGVQAFRRSGVRALGLGWVLRPAPALAMVVAVLVGAGAFAATRPASPRAGGRTAAPGSASHAKQQRPVKAGDPRPVTGISLVWTGDQNGHLEPCGCAKPQLGGMLRRAGLLQALPAGPTLRLDNGDLTEARGRQDELKAETSIQLLNQLGYTAINLGETEFRLGVPYLQYLASSFKGSLLCANARDAADRPLFTEYLLRELTVGKRPIKVGIVGLLSERFAPEVEALNPGLKIAPAAETLDRLRPTLEGRDFVILLFHGEPDEARQLVAGQGWINAVIAAHAPDDRAQEISRKGETPLLTVGQDGKYVGLAEITPAPAPGGRAALAKVRGVSLTPETPEDPAARAIEAVYLGRVADEGLLNKVPRAPIPDGDHFVGTTTCKSCHAAAHRVWTGSAHSHAWKTLVQVGHQRDPDCVGCHVVGLQFQGGFQDAARTPHLENVGCENCHRAAGRHAASPATVRPPRVGSAACAACHVPEHSPGFQFAQFWAKIRH